VVASFDGEPPITFRAIPAGGSAAIAIADGERLFERACRAKGVVIEVELAGGGRQQFRFKTEGLKWEPKQGHGPEAYPIDCRTRKA
jgi:hypothetical protein